MDADIAAMQRELASAPVATSSAAASGPTIHELLSDDRGPPPTLRHSPPERFTPGKPLRIAIAADRNAPLAAARLLYRHVDQAEDYRSAELTLSGGELQALIPAAYTASEYALQYFFELRDDRQRTRRFPGFTPHLANQPYYIVPASRVI